MPRAYVSSARSVSVALAAVLVAGNSLVRGGVSSPAAAASCGVAAACLALALRKRERDEVRIPVLVPALGAVGLVVALQLVPLPAAVVRALSPRTAATLTDTLAPLGLYPAPRPISLAPGTTALELTREAVFFAATTAGAILARSNRQRDKLLRIIALSGVATVAVYYGAALVGRSPLLEPKVTFVNPNHLAGFLQLTAWPALGFALRARGPQRWGWLVAFVFTASGIFLSLSRGGIAAFFVGVGIFAVLRMRAESTQHARRVPVATGSGSGDVRVQPSTSSARTGPIRGLELSAPTTRRSTRRMRSRSVAILGITGALAVVAWLALEPVLKEMGSIRDENSTAVKMELWPLAMRMIRDFPLVGIGRGAFTTAFPGYKWEPMQKTFSHVENEFLQLPLEFGIPVGVGVIGLSAWALLAAARRRDLSRPLAGALAGAGALVAHNVFDFSLEIPGVAIPFAVILGIASRDMPKFAVRPWVVRAAAAAVLILGATGVLVHWRHSADGMARAAIDAENADDTVARAREALRWHPVDYLPAAATGVRLAFENRCGEAVPWLLRAMTRNPTAPEAHRGMARCLAGAGRAALAKREFRLAFSYGDRGALDEAHAWYPDPGAMLDVAPDTPEGLWAAGMILRDDPAQAAEVWQRDWDSFKEPRALAQLASARLALQSNDDALGLARQLEQVAPQDPAGYVVAARALDALDRGDDAQKELELGAARLPGNYQVVAALGLKHLVNRRFSQARGIFESIVVQDGPLLAQKHLLVARALAGQGRYQEALGEVQVARDLLPTSTSVLSFFAELAGAVGRYDEAIDALELASKQPTAQSSAYDERLAKLRAAKDEAAVRKAVRDGR